MIGNKQSTEAAGLGAGNWVLDAGIIPKPEIRSPNQCRNPNDESTPIKVVWSLGLGHSSLIRVSGLVIRVYPRTPASTFQLPGGRRASHAAMKAYRKER